MLRRLDAVGRNDPVRGISDGGCHRGLAPTRRHADVCRWLIRFLRLRIAVASPRRRAVGLAPPGRVVS